MNLNRIINKLFENTQMSTFSTLCIICTFFILVSGCGRKNNDEYPETKACCSRFTSFLDGVSITSKNNNVYVIKGIASETFKNGRKIRLIEDLKGNFPKSVITFNVWKNHIGNIFDTRIDDLGLYDNQDVLIMLLVQEKPNDYTTLGCIPSVLKLSDGYVTGKIIPCWKDIIEMWGLSDMTSNEFYLWVESLSEEEYALWVENLSDEQRRYTHTMQWNDFQIKLNNLLKTN